MFDVPAATAFMLCRLGAQPRLLPFPIGGSGFEGALRLQQTCQCEEALDAVLGLVLPLAL